MEIGTVILLIAAIGALAISHHKRTTFLIQQIDIARDILDRHTTRLDILEAQLDQQRDNRNPS